MTQSNIKAPSRLTRRATLEKESTSASATLSTPTRTRFARQQTLKLATPTRLADRGHNMTDLPELSPAPAHPHKVSPVPTPTSTPGGAPRSRLAQLRAARAAAAAVDQAAADKSVTSAAAAAVGSSTRAHAHARTRDARPSLEGQSRFGARPSLEPPARKGDEGDTTPRRASARPRLSTPSKRASYRPTAVTPQRRTPAKAAATALTPSQQRQEAARRRREAAEAANEETKTHRLTTRRRNVASYRKPEETAGKGAPATATASRQRSDESGGGVRSTGADALSKQRSEEMTPTATPRGLTKQRSEGFARQRSDEVPASPTTTPRSAVARLRLLDRGYTAAVDAPSATTPSAAAAVPRRRLTGGDSTPTRLQRASHVRASRPSLPGDGGTTATAMATPVSVVRRLDVGATASGADSGTGTRSKTRAASRAEAMNAIAASTTGSHRMDVSDVVDSASTPALSDAVSVPHRERETVVPRTPGRHRGALESFRRTRRASQEAEAARRASLEADVARRASIEAEAARRVSVDPLEEDIPKTQLVDRVEPGGSLGSVAVEPQSPTPVSASTRNDGTKLLSLEVLEDNNTSTSTRGGRFGDTINVPLGTPLGGGGGAARLRESLGRRRSRGNQDLNSIAPPQLRRKSLKLGSDHKPLSVGFARLSLAEGSSGAVAPLGSKRHGHALNSNTGAGTGAGGLTKSAADAIKGFGLDDELTWADTDAAADELFNA